MSRNLREMLPFRRRPEGAELGPEDFEGFGLSAEQVRQLFEDASDVGVDRRRRVHIIGKAFTPLAGLSVPPEYKRFFTEDGLLNTPLAATGRTVMESAFESPAALARAEDAISYMANEIGSWVDA